MAAVEVAATTNRVRLGRHLDLGSNLPGRRYGSNSQNWRRKLVVVVVVVVMQHQLRTSRR